MSDTGIKELVTIESAARKIGMSRQRLKDLVVNAGAAIRWGGNEKHPYLKVRLKDAERIVLQQRHHVSDKGRKSRSRTMFHGELHPDVRC